MGNESKSTCSRCVGGPGRLPAPSPRLRWRSCWGGGGVGGRVQPGDFEQGRGDLWQASRELKWQIFLASKFGGLFSRVNPAGCHGKIFWRVNLAYYFGTFIWRVFMANETSGFQSKGKKSKRKRKEMYNQWICKLHYEHCI
jgi:hypothetical protein